MAHTFFNSDPNAPRPWWASVWAHYGIFLVTASMTANFFLHGGGKFGSVTLGLGIVAAGASFIGTVSSLRDHRRSGRLVEPYQRFDDPNHGIGTWSEHLPPWMRTPAEFALYCVVLTLGLYAVGRFHEAVYIGEAAFFALLMTLFVSVVFALYLRRFGAGGAKASSLGQATQSRSPR